MTPQYFFAPSKLQIKEGESHKSFTLVPISSEAPFIQGMYDPSTNALVLLSPHKRQHFDMITQFDQKGLPKIFKGPDGNQMYAKKLTEFSHNHEVAITDQKSIIKFVWAFCDMSKEDANFLKDLFTEEPAKISSDLKIVSKDESATESK